MPAHFTEEKLMIKLNEIGPVQHCVVSGVETWHIFGTRVLMFLKDQMLELLVLVMHNNHVMRWPPKYRL